MDFNFAETAFLENRYRDEPSRTSVAWALVVGLGRGMIEFGEIQNMRDPVVMAEKIRQLEYQLKELEDTVRDMRSSLRSL